MHHLSVVCGSPGSGKTTYARKIAAEQGSVLLDIDTCSERLVKAGLRLGGQDENDRDSTLFKQYFREAIYDTLFDIAGENLPHSDVVITGPFTREIRNPEWLNELRMRFECRVIIFYVYCEPQERRQRIEQRANPRDEGKFVDYQRFNSYYGNEEAPVFEHIFIDTSSG